MLESKDANTWCPHCSRCSGRPDSNSRIPRLLTSAWKRSITITLQSWNLNVWRCHLLSSSSAVRHRYNESQFLTWDIRICIITCMCFIILLKLPATASPGNLSGVFLRASLIIGVFVRWRELAMHLHFIDQKKMNACSFSPSAESWWLMMNIAWIHVEEGWMEFMNTTKMCKHTIIYFSPSENVVVTPKMHTT